MKLVSLVLALALESYFYSPDNSITLNVRGVISVADIPRALMITEPVGAEKGISTRIKVRGPASLVDQVRSQVLNFTVHAPADHLSEFVVPVDLEQLGLPAGVEVESVNPASVHIKTEKIAKKELRIVVETQGTLAEGFRIEEMEVFPPTVVVRGPVSRVEGLRSIKTQPMDISNASASRKQELSLAVEDPLLSMGVTMVSVDLKVDVVREEKRYNRVGIKVLAPDGFAATVQPSRASVVLTASVKELEKLSATTLTLVADGRELSGGRHEVPLRGEFGQGVKIIKTVPEKVKIMLVKQDG